MIPTDARTRRRLGLFFGVFTLVSLLCAAYAMTLIASAERDVYEIAETNNRKIALANRMATAVSTVARVIPGIVLSDDASQIADEIGRIDHARADYDRAWSAFQALSEREASQPWMADIRARASQARAINDAVIRLARSGQDDEATMLLLTRAVPTTAAFLAAIEAEISAVSTDNEQRLGLALRAHRRARFLLVGIAIVSLGFGLSFGWLSRQVVSDLRTALTERNNLLGVLGHEVARPLTVASTAIEAAITALESGTGGPDAASAGPMRRIQSELCHVQGALRNSLAAADLVSSGRHFGVNDVDIDTVVGLAIGDLSAEDRQRVHVRRLTQARTAELNADLIRLALRNLLDNALAYSPRETPVDLHILDSDDPLALVFEVRDLGAGVAPELKDVMFDRGVRGDTAAAVMVSPGKGLGLGLFIVRRIVALHRGEIEVRDNAPSGSVFRIVLPQAVFN